jgi:hypothetical protein
MDPAWVTAAVAVAVAVVGCAAWCLRWLIRFGRRMLDFLDDWGGHPARPGVPPRPGVLERLQTVEFTLGEVRGQVFPDSGTSMRDDITGLRNVVHQTAADVSEIKDEQGRVRSDLAKIQEGRQP